MTKNLVALTFAAGMFAASTTGAYAESLTSRIIAWNSANEMVSFTDGTQKILPRYLVPVGLRTGDGVTVVFESRSVEGLDRIRKITILDTRYVDQASGIHRYTPF